MPLIYLTKDNLVWNLFTEDEYYKTLIIPEAQFEKINVFPDYHAWKYNEQEDTFTLVPILSEHMIRSRRQTECFSIIDTKSRLWWDSLSPTNYSIIKQWYQDWLDAPATKKIPELPEILKQGTKGTKDDNT